MRKSRFYLAAAAVAIGGAGSATPAHAQEYFIGEIVKVGFNFCPRNFLGADGQLLAINSNTALFSLYGTTYGGDGVTTFALPDMRSRNSMHLGQGPGLSNRPLGQTGGTETNTMTLSTMPRHNHAVLLRATSDAANVSQTFRNIFATTPANKYVSGTAPSGQLMNRETVITQNEGDGTSYNHIPPFLTIRYCVAQFGIFPPRN